MKRLYNKYLIETYLKQTKYENEMKSLQNHLFIIQYKKGEFAALPLQEEHLFQIVVKGSLNIYFIRDDGSAYSLANGQKNYLLGEMEIFSSQKSSVYAQANDDLTCLALSIEKNKDKLMKNCLFLQLICESLTHKIEFITTIDAAPASLKQRVLTYMKYKCADGELKGLQQAAFHLNCSSRQLQRILNQHQDSGIVIKTGKGTYKLIDTQCLYGNKDIFI